MSRQRTTAHTPCPHHPQATRVAERRPHGIYWRCQECRVANTVRRRQEKGARLAREHGGRCLVCHYAACASALHFHHLQPQHKEFSLSAYATRSMERLRDEARKCVLLCANCHAALEQGDITLDRVVSLWPRGASDRGLAPARGPARQRSAAFVPLTGRRTQAEGCPRHPGVPRVQEPNGRMRCPTCRSEAVVRWRQRHTAALIAARGGKCQECGYSQSVAALHFHHRSRSDKSFGVRDGQSRSLARMRQEVEKCDLLCANCHAAREDMILSQAQSNPR